MMRLVTSIALLLFAVRVSAQVPSPFCDPSVSNSSTTNLSMCKPEAKACNWDVCLNSFIDDVDTNLSTVVGALDLTVFNVTSYGAVADDGLDDATAFQNAISDASDASGGAVYIPPGTFNLSGITIDPDGKLLMFGAGMGRTLLKGTTANTDVITIGDSTCTNDTTRVVIRDMTIRGFNGTGTGSGLVLYYLAESDISDVEVDNHGGDGIVMKRVEHSRFSGLRVYGNGRYGANISQLTTCSVTRPSNVNTFVSCRFNQNDYNVYMDGGEANTFVGCKFDTASTTGVRLQGVSGYNASKNVFVGNHFEQTSGVDLDIAGDVSQLVDGGAIIANTFAGSGSFGLRLAYAKGITIASNRFMNGYTNSIEIGANSMGNRVISNTIDNTFSIASGSNTEYLGRNWNKTTQAWVRPSTLIIGDGTGANQTLTFDHAGTDVNLYWDNSSGLMQMNSDFRLSDPAGTTTFTIGRDVSEDVYVAFDLSGTNELLYWDNAGSTFRVSDDFRVDDNLVINGVMTIGQDVSEDLYFYFDVSGANELFYWDNANATFRLSDDLLVDDTITAGGGLIQAGKDGQDGQLVIYSDDAGGDATVTINPAVMAGDVVYTLPADDGNAGDCLTTDGNGVLSWSTCNPP